MSAYPKNIWHHFSVHLYYLVHDALIEQLQEKRTFLKMVLNFFFFFLTSYTPDLCYHWWPKEIRADAYI